MRLNVLLIALLLDLLFGEPPNRLHPVAWMGSAIGKLRRHAPKEGRLLPFIFGAGISAGGAAVMYMLGVALRHRRNPTGHPYLNIFRMALLLKFTFSLRGLNTAAWEVEVPLREGNLPEARRLLSWHLVSRETSHLNESQIAAAGIESIAENTSDGIIAPLFFYLIGGLPAAYAYRWAQTCDSMLGYRDAKREWLGKVSARFDDLLNLIPSRLTALLFVLVSGKPGHAWRIWRRDGNKTASPNAGQPMSAAAGALGIELEKVEHYRLGDGLRAPGAYDISRARWMMFKAVGVFVSIVCAVVGAWHAMPLPVKRWLRGQHHAD